MNSGRCTISKVPRNNLYKKTEKSFLLLMCYIYIQSTTKRKQQRSTDKDTTSKLKHSQSVTLKKNIVKHYFFHSLYSLFPRKPDLTQTSPLTFRVLFAYFPRQTGQSLQLSEHCPLSASGPQRQIINQRLVPMSQALTKAPPAFTGKD